MLADFDDFDQFRRIIVQVHHVAGFFGGLRTGVHGHTHVGLGQGGGVVGTVAHHGHQLAFGLFAADVVHFILRFGFGNEVVHAGHPGDVFGGQRVIAGDHHRFYAHPAQAVEALPNTWLDDVLQFDDALHPFVHGHHQRGTALRGDIRHLGFCFHRKHIAGLHRQVAHGIEGALADADAIGHIHARRAGLRAEFDHVGALDTQPLGDVFTGQFHHGFALRRVVGQRRERRKANELGFLDAGCRVEMRGLAVPDGNGASLVEQQYVQIAGGFHRLTRFSDHVGAQRPVHARNTDGREQAADGGRNEADVQRNERGNGQSGVGVIRERLERDADDGEHQRETGQQDGQRDFVGRFLALGALHEGDHFIQKAFAGLRGDQHFDAVAEHLGAASHAGFVAAGLADHRCGFAGDGTLVDGGQPFDDLTIGWNGVAGLAEKHIAFAQRRRRHRFRGQAFATYAAGRRLGAGFPQAVGLGFAARFGDGFGEVREQQRRE